MAADHVQIIHDVTDRITTVPRGQVNVLARSGWRLLSSIDEPTDPTPAEPAEPIHIGGGWYELPDGTHVHGREAADAALDG
jgi:hypothetical protein